MNPIHSIVELQEYLRSVIHESWETTDEFGDEHNKNSPMFVLVRYFQENAWNRIDYLSFASIRAAVILWEHLRDAYPDYFTNIHNAQMALEFNQRMVRRIENALLHGGEKMTKEDLKSTMEAFVPEDDTLFYIGYSIYYYIEYLLSGDCRKVMYSLSNAVDAFGQMNYGGRYRNWFIEKAIPNAIGGRAFDEDEFRKTVLPELKKKPPKPNPTTNLRTEERLRQPTPPIRTTPAPHHYKDPIFQSVDVIMNRIRKVLKTINSPISLSDVSLNIEFDQTQYHQGETIRGRLLLRNGPHSRFVRKLTIELRSFSIKLHAIHIPPAIIIPTLSKTTKCHSKVIMPDPLQLSPNEQCRIPFEIELPRNSVLPTPPDVKFFRSGWEIHVRLHLRRAWDAKREFIVTVAPSTSFLAIVGACEHGPGFREIVAKRRHNAKKQLTYFAFLPPPHLEPLIKRLNLAMTEEEDGSVHGTAIVDPPMQSPGAFHYRLKEPFRLAADQILDPKNQPNNTAILQEISRALEAALAPKG